DIFKSVVNSFRLLAEEKRATIMLEKSSGPLMIWGDEDHLKAVFSNMLDNALKYSGENSKITLSLTQEDNHVKISIKDNGIGMSADQQKRIFEKFYRVQGGNLHEVKGFGLGLSYAKSIVDLHNGSI